MDLIKRMNIEFPGIAQTIKEYSGDGYVLNFVDQLTDSLRTEDAEPIAYLLGRLIHWYDRNMGRIKANPFVFNHEQHDLNRRMLVEFASEIEGGALRNFEPKREVGPNMTNKFFISHSSEDKGICTPFVSMMEQLGVPEEDIIYTSSDRHGVPGDVDIFQYLGEHIRKGIRVFYMLSDNYYNSPYCLNEMGAAWTVQNEYSMFLLPRFSVGIQGVVDRNKKAFRVSSPQDLRQFRNKITGIYGHSISESRWEEAKNEFLEAVKSYQED